MLVTSVISFLNTGRSPVVAVPTFVRDLVIEPDRANSHVAFVGDVTLTQTGTTGVVSSLAVPAASNGILDRYERKSCGGELSFDAGPLYVWGTQGEKVNCSWTTI